MSSLSQKPGMPRIIPLPGATTIERVEENSKNVLLDPQDMDAIGTILAKFPVHGDRFPPVLQAFVDK